MKEIPILYSTPMIQAKIAGIKTQTRRVIKPQPEMTVMGGSAYNALIMMFGPQDAHGWTWKGTRFFPWPEGIRIYCRYGQPGDLHWVRETTRRAYDGNGDFSHFQYKADNDPLHDTGQKWTPSIHMPKQAARIWEEVISIRVERLQDISEEDAIAEGVELAITTTLYVSAKVKYQMLWEIINGPGSWEINPWVWAITTKTLSTTGKP